MYGPKKEKNEATNLGRLLNLNLRKAGLWIPAVFLPFFIIGWVTSGCFYMPTKHDGLFLPTLSTFFFSAAASGYCLSAMLSIMLYRKTMPHKKCQFLRTRRNSRKTALYLLILVIPIVMFEEAMLACGLDLFSFVAVGRNFALWRPEMVPLAKLFNIDIYVLVGPILAAFVLAFVFFFRWKRLSLSLLALSSFLLAFLWLVKFAIGYFPGEIVEISHTQQISYVSAIQDPAKFNAMVLWNCATTILFFLFGVVALITALTAPKVLAKASKTKTNR